MSIPTPRQKLAALLVIVWLIATAWWNVRSESPYRVLLQNDPTSPLFKFAHQYDDIDKTAERLLPASGNLAIGFRGYDATDARDQATAARIYLRSVYRVYPRRVYPLIAAGVSANGQSLLQSQVRPDESWLREHGVGALALFSKLPNGEESVQRFEIPQPAMDSR